MTKAASFLHITQPTLSRQMKELEEEIGHPLFIRESHRLSLTAEGMHLRKRAEEITDLVGKTKEEFSSFEKKIAGDVYIGGGETHGMTLIAEVVKEVRQAYPLIRCHLHSGNAETVTERLDKGLLDFGLLIQPTDLDKYHSLRLPEKDIWGVVMPKSSDLAGKKALTKEDLRGKPLICSQQALRKTATGNDGSLSSRPLRKVPKPRPLRPRRRTKPPRAKALPQGRKGAACSPGRRTSRLRRW